MRSQCPQCNMKSEIKCYHDFGKVTNGRVFSTSKIRRFSVESSKQRIFDVRKPGDNREIIHINTLFF